MGGFRRAQLRGSDELFRTTDSTVADAEANTIVEVPAQTVLPRVTKVAEIDSEGDSAVPRAPKHDSRSLRLTGDEIEILADALQFLKFPNKSPARPSVDEFEGLEELRQKLLDNI